MKEEHLLLKLIGSFIFGGLLMVIIYVSANLFNNGALSAIITMLPLSILSCFIIKKDVIFSHCSNIIPVFIISTISILLILAFLKYTTLDKTLIILLILMLWVLAILTLYKYSEL
jgi:hypothetical protein